MAKSDGNLLERKPFDDPSYLPSRLESQYRPLHTYDLPKGADRQYKQQFADIYFLRLSQLKEAVRQKAQDTWGDFTLGQERAKMVHRVLDVRQGELCWIIGTAYLEMGLKPNILDDIAKEHWIAAPPSRETYIAPSTENPMMLEDESGRLRLTGHIVDDGHSYVTGCILAVLGTEQADGSFEVIATQCADLPRQPQRWEAEDSALTVAKKSRPNVKREKAGKLAIVSGLELTGSGDDDLSLDLLLEYLTGDACGSPEQTKASKISRLVIAGNSLAHSSPILSRDDFAARKAEMTKNKQYGYDASSYNATPAERLDTFLSQILPCLPITLLPGVSDPANVALPQQPLHPALFPKCRQWANPPTEMTTHGLDSVTNPWEGDIEGWRVVGTGGQNVDDLLKYVDDVTPLEAMEQMLRWRCIAPTAPDTLWCYPFQDDDPLIVKDCPHIYFVGNQPRFAKTTIQGPARQEVLLISVPRFSQRREIVVVDMETKEVELVDFAVADVRP